MSFKKITEISIQNILSMISGLEGWIITFALAAFATALHCVYTRWFTIGSLTRTAEKVDQLLKKYESAPTSESTLSFEECRHHRVCLRRNYVRVMEISLDYTSENPGWIQYLSLRRLLRRFRAIWLCYMEISALQKAIELSVSQKLVRRYLDFSAMEDAGVLSYII
ncbi:hypothetical protein GYMLUDRAFT_588747 [Collybiopsis luxurians FD-317 M1]|uniref:Uncharacterized protein n=1 Tax=Collybiopsis luxurians FD-317 M1 TaxID=944289 RepID=A0A0D0BZ20_9AGAR|nr:hypothetical protein GYMLUDRAFT_588747 [Collybiopsis luxurians FD-317 M1]